MVESYQILQSFDFAIPLAITMNEGRELKNTIKVDSLDPEYSSIFELQYKNSNGSGVVIALRDSPIEIGRFKYCALALTAGHLIGNSFRSKKNPVEYCKGSVTFRLPIYDKSLAPFLVIEDYSDINAQSHIDSVSGFPYALPNDLAIILLNESIKPHTKPMKIAQRFDESEEIHIVGFPKAPSHLVHCCPCLRDESHENAKIKIKTAFCNFKSKVKSSGRMIEPKAEENYLLSGDYSATSGMSGSPVFVERDGEKFIVGINIGGRSLPYESELVSIIEIITQGDYPRALETFREVANKIKKSKLFNFRLLDKKAKATANEIKKGSNEISIRKIVKFKNQMAVAYKTPIELNHNLSLPIWNNLFINVQNYIRKFEEMPDMSFESREEFVKYLNS